MSRPAPKVLLKTVVLCAAFAVAGPAIILINKWILTTGGFPYPYCLTCMGLITSWAIATFLVKGLRVVPLENSMSLNQYMTTIMPIGGCQALAMGFGTVAYLSLTVAFIQMLKAFTPVITLLVLYALSVETPSTALVLSVVGISIGTVIAVYGEVQLDMFGLVIHEVSAVAEATRLVLTQKLLKERFGTIEALYFMAPAGAICMVMLVILFELPTIISTGDYMRIYEHGFVFLAASILGFLLNILSFGIIQLSSSLMLKGISVARTAGLVLFCATFLGETVTRIESVGYSVSLCSFVWYNYIRVQESAGRA